MSSKSILVCSGSLESEPFLSPAAPSSFFADVSFASLSFAFGAVLSSGLPCPSGLQSSATAGLPAAFSSSLRGASGDLRSLRSTTTYALAVTGILYAPMLLAVAGPSSVLARKYRYLPLLSKEGEPASLRPSVTWWAVLSSVPYTNTAPYVLSSDRL